MGLGCVYAEGSPRRIWEAEETSSRKGKRRMRLAGWGGGYSAGARCQDKNTQPVTANGGN